MYIISVLNLFWAALAIFDIKIKPAKIITLSPPPSPASRYGLIGH